MHMPRDQRFERRDKWKNRATKGWRGGVREGMPDAAPVESQKIGRKNQTLIVLR